MTNGRVRACQRCEGPLSPFRSALTAKDLKFRFRTSALHWLPKIWSSAFALPLCLDSQRSDVRLPHFWPALSAKDLKFCFRTFDLPWVPKNFHTSALPGLPKIWSSASVLPLPVPGLPKIEVPLLHFRSARTSKDLTFRFCTSAQPWLPKIWSSAFALPLCLDSQRSEVRLPHFWSALSAKNVKFHTSALPGLPKIWSSASVLRLSVPGLPKIEVPLPHFRSVRTSKDLTFRFRTSALPWLPKIWSSASALLLYTDCQRSEVLLSHFHSPLTLKDLMFGFRTFDLLWVPKNVKFHTSALPGLPKIWSSASVLPLSVPGLPKIEVPLPHFRSALTTKFWFRFHISALPWLPKIWSSASALPLCLEYQRAEVRLPYFWSALSDKNEKFRYTLPLCQDFQRCEVPLPHFLDCKRCEVPLPHFHSALTDKELTFRFRTFALFWLPKIWFSASSLPPDLWRCDILRPHFRCTFLLCISTQFNWLSYMKN